MSLPTMPRFSAAKAEDYEKLHARSTGLQRPSKTEEDSAKQERDRQRHCDILADPEVAKLRPLQGEEMSGAGMALPAATIPVQEV